MTYMPVCGRSQPNTATSGFPQSFCSRCLLLPCCVPPSHPVGVTYCEKKKKHSWSLGWDFWGSQKDSLSALDDRYDRGTQKAISHIKTKSALGPFIFFSGSLVAICHLSEKKVESARGFFLAMVGWCLPMTWDLSVFNQLVHWSQDHVGNKRLLLQTVQTLSILLMFPGVNFGTWLPK